MAFLFIPSSLPTSGSRRQSCARSPRRQSGRSRQCARRSFRTLFSAVVVVLAAAVGFALPLNERTTDAILIAAIRSFLTLMTLALLPVLQAELRMHWAVAGSVTGRLVTLGATARWSSASARAWSGRR